MLMILLAILAVGLLSLSTVTLRSSTHDMVLAEAQANARMGLMIAIGELQKTMGPDRRMSAYAATLAGDVRVGHSLPPETPQAWWVGVSHSDPSQNVDPAGGIPVVWLVSGLEKGVSPAQQLSSSFALPVDMYSDNSINTAALTGGEPIRAGKIDLAAGANGKPGAYAWFVEDDGMKAQLAASHAGVRNNLPEPPGGGILPVSFDIGILGGLDSISGTPPETAGRLLSINDLPLIGAPKDMARNKRFSYTTRSAGVLSDVKNGGLKKDLTIAFERDDVFGAVFGDGVGFPAKYIVMEESKFTSSPDLLGNGYIHWDMLRDFYNIKRHIQTDGSGKEYLPGTKFRNNGLRYTEGSDNQFPFMNGRLGPHQIGNNANTPDLQKQLPYGSYMNLDNQVMTPQDNYQHNPVSPILMRFQQNAWLERLVEGGEELISTNVQIWIAQYNPYNINLDNGTAYCRGFSTVDFDHPGLMVRRWPDGYTIGTTTMPQWPKMFMTANNSTDFQGFLGRTQMTTANPITLGPGRSHVMAIQRDSNNSTENNNGYYLSGAFGENVKDLTMESSFMKRPFFPAESTPGKLTYSFYNVNNINHGGLPLGLSNNNRYFSVSQMLWKPYSWDGLGNKNISFDNVGINELNENTMASFSLSLRTTQEPTSSTGPAIRPLVDANVRALLGNTRWDSPLGLNVLAAYNMENKNEVDEQIMQMDVQDDPKGYAYWGGGRDPVDGYERVILFDIPRQDLVSLGQLQHANVGRFSYEPTYVIGNSYANLRIPLTDWKASISDTLGQSLTPVSNERIAGNFNLYDASYLANEALWDTYTFTTIPQMKDNRDPASEEPPNATLFSQLLNRKAHLPNPRYLPYEPAGSKFDLATLQQTTPVGQKTGGFHHNAGHVMVDGSFNVNSVSVDAWEAFLSGTHKLPYQKIGANGAVSGFESDVDGVRFPRVQATLGGPTKRGSLDENYWTGFRSLEQTEVRDLAEKIVAEVKKRGPFMSMADFVNRRLVTGELGQRGALQAALDASVNKDLDSGFESNANQTGIPGDSTQGAGFPGQLLQGDILQSLAPYMTVRSDTFTIRAYGESRSADGSKILAQAWCEATVQRYPDPVPNPQAGRNTLTELAEPSSPFGRRFEIIAFRWLHPKEI